MPDLLLIDDNPADIDLATEALHDVGYDAHIGSACDGEAAVRLLTRYVDDPDKARPLLVLLDLNMPKLHGNEVLAFIAAHRALRDIPVVVLTTSDSPADCQRSLAMGAREYLVKPSTYDDLIDLMSRLKNIYLDEAASR